MIQNTMNGKLPTTAKLITQEVPIVWRQLVLYGFSNAHWPLEGSSIRIYWEMVIQQPKTPLLKTNLMEKTAFPTNWNASAMFKQELRAVSGS